ncbi:MAG TPA: MG2 domain-containing protein, partial [Pyrinomonadaceae bacterium]|nr:MG2 domain-containing protein [Pyrinomonadaceae bacterium]
MSRKWLLFLFCLALLILLSPRSRASLTVRVNEPACRIFLQHNNLDVAIVVENSLPAATGQHLRVELLDPRDRVTAHAERDESIQRGSQTLHFLLPFDSSKLNETERRAFLWYRLHYQLTAPGGAVTADGILSLSETTPDLFDLRVAAAELVHEAMRYRARVQAVHPVTKKPAEGVRLDAVLTLETDDSGNGVKIAAAGVTDAKGYATLFFDIPQRFPEFPHESQPAGGSLKVTGQRNGVTAEVEHDVLVDQFARMLLTTDKPLYQPGQGLHMRTMVFSPTKHALANQDVMFRIEDPENMTVFRETVKSSRFGIATVDWPIPENARLGD